MSSENGSSGKVGLDDFFAAGHTVEDLMNLAVDKLPHEQREPGTKGSGPYLETSAGLVYLKPTGEDAIPVPLTNWTANITTDIQLDDGATEEMQREFEIEARLDGKVSQFRVPARKFTPVDPWVREHIGASALITATPNVEKRIAEAIVRFSNPKTCRRHIHTGFRLINGVWGFLHADGAIAEEGLVKNLEVELPGPLQKSFRLPAPVEGEEKINAVRASLRLLDLAADKITVPVFCAIYRAPLGAVDFVLWLVGETGVFKTECAVLAQQHFGIFTSRTLPGNFSSTINSIEEWAFILKDCLFVVDNFRPRGTLVDRQKMEASADRFVQSTGDGAGRGRMWNRKAEAGRPPRGMGLCTGEESPSAHSTLGRAIRIEMKAGDVNSVVLTAAQADSDLYRVAMSCYLRWLAGRLDSTRVRMRARVADLRAEFAIPRVHARTPGNLAELMFGAEVFAEFAVECGAVTDAGKLLKRIKTALVETAQPQAAAQKEEEPVNRFFSFLRSAINARRACIFATGADGLQNRSAAWGWPDDSAAPDQVGWYDAALDELYLDPEAAYRAAAGMVADGHGIGVKLTTLKRLLKDKGMLKRTGHDEGRVTPLSRETIQGVRQAVLVLSAKVLTEVEL